MGALRVNSYLRETQMAGKFEPLYPIQAKRDLEVRDNDTDLSQQWPNKRSVVSVHDLLNKREDQAQNKHANETYNNLQDRDQMTVDKLITDPITFKDPDGAARTDLAMAFLSQPLGYTIDTTPQSYRYYSVSGRDSILVSFDSGINVGHSVRSP